MEVPQVTVVSDNFLSSPPFMPPAYLYHRGFPHLPGKPTFAPGSHSHLLTVSLMFRLTFYQSLLLGRVAGGSITAYVVAGASGRQCGSISADGTEGRVGGVRRKEKALYI